MSEYAKIAVPVDLSGESETIIRQALEVACDGAELHLLYVQEPMDTVYLGVVPYGPVFVGMDQVEERLQDELKEKLRGLGKAFDIPQQRQHFLHGTPAKEIHRFVEEHDIDLVVLGTHGQKGVQLLLGSTANSVLHGAPCDVLAVRIRDAADDS
ncbi:MAG: universal stress protein [Xanthomonadales bacterium]|nr:universal stress protein [Xanthomonadales bacterium]